MKTINNAVSNAASNAVSVEMQLNLLSADSSLLEQTGMSQSKFASLSNIGCDSKDKNTTRKDIYTAKTSVFIIEEGFNVRDNGFRNGVDPDKARRYADFYLNGVEFPPLIVMRVIVDGLPRLKIIDGNNRLTGALIAKEESGKEFILPYTISRANNEADQIVEMLNTGDSLALTSIDKGNGYKRLENCGWDENRIALNFGVTTKEVKDCIRLSNLPEKIKQSIRDSEISWTRVFKLYDTYPTLTEAESAIELEIEGGQQANADAALRGDTAIRNRHSNVFRKKNVGKKLAQQLSDSVTNINAYIESSLTIEENSNLTDDSLINISVPRHILEELLAASNELLNIKSHNLFVEESISKRKDEKKAQH